MPVTLGHPLLDIVARCVVVYLALLVGLRLMGKRQVGKLTPFDLLFLLILSDAVQNAMLGPNDSLVGGLVAAGTLFAVNTLMARVARLGERPRRLLEGSPALLMRDGEFLDDHLDHEGISRDDMLQALREHGIDDPSTVRQAILEVDGSISVLKKEDMPAQARPHHSIRGIRRRG